MWKVFVQGLQIPVPVFGVTSHYRWWVKIQHSPAGRTRIQAFAIRTSQGAEEGSSGILRGSETDAC